MCLYFKMCGDVVYVIQLYPGVVELKHLLGCFDLRQIDSVFFPVDDFFPCRDLSS
jgi:hypothetical protein